MLKEKQYSRPQPSQTLNLGHSKRKKASQTKNRRRRAAGRKIKELKAASDKDTTLQTAPDVSSCSSRPSSDHEAGMGSLRTSKDDTEPSFELESKNGLVRQSVSDHAEDDATLDWRSRSSTDNGSNPSIEKSDVMHPPNMPKTALVPISGMVAAISPVKFSKSFTEPYTAQERDVWAADSPCLQCSTPSDSTEQQSPEVFIPLSFNTHKDGLMLELNDAAWDHPPLKNGLQCKSGDKFMPFTDAMNDITGFEAVEPSTEAVPRMQPRKDARRQISNESINNNLQDQEEANERIMSAAIMCLSRDKDMEQAYVCILSIISVLQKGGRPQCSSIESARKLLRVMAQPRIAERLGEEIRRQGVLAPGALYAEIYQAMTNAGYPLEVNASFSSLPLKGLRVLFLLLLQSPRGRRNGELICMSSKNSNTIISVYASFCWTTIVQKTPFYASPRWIAPYGPAPRTALLSRVISSVSLAVCRRQRFCWTDTSYTPEPCFFRHMKRRSDPTRIIRSESEHPES